MTNVLSLVPYKIFPATLGGQKSISQFNEYLSRYHKLICVTVRENDPGSASFEILNILGSSRFRYINFLYFFRLKSLIKSRRISHVILSHPYYGWLGLLLKKSCKIKLIVRSENVESQRFKSLGKGWWKLMYVYERMVHRRVDYTFAITETDRDFFVKAYKVGLSKISVIPFGIKLQHPPAPEAEANSKSVLRRRYNILPGTTLILFNGAFRYHPNLEALKIIERQIDPLLTKENIPYTIIVCGTGLEHYHFKSKKIINAGFVDDIELYLQGTDIFINPVISGGGIKTKLVEAIGYGKTAVSTVTGAFGVDVKFCGSKLLIVRDKDWDGFTMKILEATNVFDETPPSFYEHFYWDNIARKTASIIDSI